MAYPLTRFPTLEEFIARSIADYGAKLKKVDGGICGPRGNVEIEVLIIGDGDNAKFAPIPNINGDDVLVPDMIRSLCEQLNIPPRDFGLHLD